MSSIQWFIKKYFFAFFSLLLVGGLACQSGFVSGSVSEEERVLKLSQNDKDRLSSCTIEGQGYSPEIITEMINDFAREGLEFSQKMTVLEVLDFYEEYNRPQLEKFLAELENGSSQLRAHLENYEQVVPVTRASTVMNSVGSYFLKGVALLVAFASVAKAENDGSGEGTNGTNITTTASGTTPTTVLTSTNGTTPTDFSVNSTMSAYMYNSTIGVIGTNAYSVLLSMTNQVVNYLISTVAPSLLGEKDDDEKEEGDSKKTLALAIGLTALGVTAVTVIGYLAYQKWRKSKRVRKELVTVDVNNTGTEISVIKTDEEAGYGGSAPIESIPLKQQ